MTADKQDQTVQNAPQGGTTTEFKPADQPKPPNPDWNNDKSKGYCKRPEWPPYTPADPTADPCTPTCQCQGTPNKPIDCIDTLINNETSTITAAERAKSFKTDLEALAQKSKTAQDDYTQIKYEALLDRWWDEDKQIVELIARLTCAVHCWKCVLECRVCSLYVKVRDLERLLYGKDTTAWPTAIDSLYDLRYWQTRDKERKQARFDRIKGVLGAWEKPAQTIEKVLNDNATLIQSAGKTLAPDMPKLLYDVFMRLVPMHLLIAPPAEVRETKIDKQYTKVCTCDPGTSDSCCGPDVGTPSLLERLLGPQPYLIKPEQYTMVICCLTTTQYLPAKTALAAAEGELEKTESRIKRTKADIDERTKSVEKDAKTELGKEIDCNKEKEIPKEPKKPHQGDGGGNDTCDATQQGDAAGTSASASTNRSQTSDSTSA